MALIHHHPTTIVAGKRFIVLLLALLSSHLNKMMMVHCEECPIDVDAALEMLLTPRDNPSLQLQSMRRTLAQRLDEAIARDQANTWSDALNPADPVKRSAIMLARAGQFGGGGENVAASGASADEQQVSEPVPSPSRRGIESLARNGELAAPRPHLDSSSFLKRSLSSLARNDEIPQYGKRNLASIVRGRRTDMTWNDDDVPQALNDPAMIEEPDTGTDQDFSDFPYGSGPLMQLMPYKRFLGRETTEDGSEINAFAQDPLYLKSDTVWKRSPLVGHILLRRILVNRKPRNRHYRRY